MLLKFIIILSTHLCLGFQNGLFPSGYLTKILCTFLFFSMHAVYVNLRLNARAKRVAWAQTILLSLVTPAFNRTRKFLN